MTVSTNFHFRKATPGDADTITRIIAESVNGISRDDYNDAQLQAALGSAFGLDSELIRDQTYFVVEDHNTMIACGGWSKRKTLFGSDKQPGREAELLNSETESARIRAFFILPSYARKGIGSALLTLCEEDARQHGFRSAALMATIPGHRLYKARGYIGDSQTEHELPGKIVIQFIPMTKALA